MKSKFKGQYKVENGVMTITGTENAVYFINKHSNHEANRAYNDELGWRTPKSLFTYLSKKYSIPFSKITKIIIQDVDFANRVPFYTKAPRNFNAGNSGAPVLKVDCLSQQNLDDIILKNVQGLGFITKATGEENQIREKRKAIIEKRAAMNFLVINAIFNNPDGSVAAKLTKDRSIEIGKTDKKHKIKNPLNDGAFAYMPNDIKFLICSFLLPHALSPQQKGETIKFAAYNLHKSKPENIRRMFNILENSAEDKNKDAPVNTRGGR